LPAAFKPAGQDGEVSEHRLVGIAETLELIADGQMTVDASLVTLDWLLRTAQIDPASPGLAGIDALFSAPAV
jgi:hypothetical protein